MTNNTILHFLENLNKMLTNNKMDDSSILLDIKENSDISLDDLNRKEVLWTEKSEQLLEKWKDKCERLAIKYNTKAKKKKQQYLSISIPAVCIPIFSGSLSHLLQTYEYALPVCLLTTGLCTGMLGLFNLSETYHRCFSAEGRYSDMAMSIDLCLSKKKSERAACDLSLERFRSQISKLDLSSPPL